MSDKRNNVVTWDRSVAQGSPCYRSRDTASTWEIGHDGYGWCLTKDGQLVQWYADLEEAMAWLGEEESRLKATDDGHGDPDDPEKRKFLVSLVREITVRQYQAVSIEVEAVDEEEAEEKAIQAAEDDDLDDEWEVVDSDGLTEILVSPSASSVEVI